MDPADTLRHALDEYRFQVRLNADRVNYWYTLNAAMIVAGAALAAGLEPDQQWIAAVVLTISAATSALCALAVHTQHSYYRAARDRAMQAATDAGVPDLLKTTPGMRKETATRFRIATIIESIFGLLGLVALISAAGILGWIGT